MIACWLAPVSINGSSSDPHCDFSATGDVLHSVYLDGTSVMYTKSSDEGTTWSAGVSIATAQEVPLTSCIAADGNYVHVVYVRSVNDPSNPPTIYYRRSTDGGANWSGEVTIDDGTGVANNQFVRVSLKTLDGYVHLFWTTTVAGTFAQSVLSYRRSTDNGATWDAEVQINSGTTTQAGRPDSALSGTKVHVTWTDKRHGSTNNGGETYYVRSDDRGTSWGTEQRITTTAAQDTLRATVASEGSNVVLAWQYPINTEDIQWTHSNTNGDSWASIQTLSGTGIQEHATLGYDDGIVALTYTDRNVIPDTTNVRYSYDAGATFSSPQVPYVPGADTAAPVLAFTSRFVHVLDRQAVAGGVNVIRSPLFSSEPSASLLDDFNRASLGANWTTPGILTATDPLVIVGNTALGRSASGEYRQGGYWNAAQFSAVDVIVELSAWTNADGNGLTLWARLGDVGSPATVDGYGFDIAYAAPNVEWSLWDRTNGSTGSMATGVASLATGDLLALTCRGTLIIGWRKPSAGEWTQLGAVIDSDHVTGYVGAEFKANQQTLATNLWASENAVPIVETSTGRRVLRRSRGGSW